MSETSNMPDEEQEARRARSESLRGFINVGQSKLLPERLKRLMQEYLDGHEAALAPHSIEAEQALLGAILLNNEAYDRVAPLVAPHHFYDPVHGRVFEIMARRISKGALASPITLRPLLQDDEGMQELGGAEYLVTLAEATISIAAIRDYAEMIRDLALRRDLLRIATEIEARAQAFSPEDEASDQIAEAEKALATLARTGSARQAVITASQAAQAAVERMNQAFKGEVMPGIDLGIPELTEKLGNVQDGDVILLGGRPSMGKSAVALHMALSCADRDIGVVYWCGEMAPEDNAERALSAFAKQNGVTVPYHNARRGRMSEDEFRAIIEAGTRFERLPISFIEPSITDIERLSSEVRREVRKHQRKGRKCLVALDYLQQITVRNASRYETVTAASQSVKAMAVDLRVPVVLLSQLSRQVETRENKRPVLSDLRESGQIEQDANSVLFCYRDEYYSARLAQAEEDPVKKSALIAAAAQSQGVMELIIAKQRSGPIDTVEVGFDGATNTVYKLSPYGAGQAEFKDFGT